jgi:hypothetical protein
MPLGNVDVPVAPAVEAQVPARFRLKPKLPTQSEETPAAAPAAVEPVVIVSPVQLPAVEEPAGMPRFKIKSLASVADAEPAVQPLDVPPPPVPLSSEGAVIPVPAPPPPSADFLVPPPPSVPLPPPLVGGLPPLAAAPDVLSAPLASLPAVPKFVPPPSGSRRLIFIAVLVVLVVTGLGAGAYFYLMSGSPPPAPVVVRPASQPSAQPVVTAQPQAVVDTLPKPRPAAVVAIPELPPPPGAVRPATVVESAPPIKTAPVVSAAFRLWIDNARITGVVVGASPRAIINGRLVRQDDMVDASEGIVFQGVDVELKELIFRDRVGAVASKPY